MTPRIDLDPAGRELTVISLNGEPRDVTVWGAVLADDVLALVCTDVGEDRPTPAELAGLADQLNHSIVDALVRTENERDEARALFTAKCREIEAFQREVIALRGERMAAHDAHAHALEQVDVLREQVEALRAVPQRLAEAREGLARCEQARRDLADQSRRLHTHQPRPAGRWPFRTRSTR